MGCEIQTDSIDIFCHCTDVDNATLLNCIKEHPTARHLTIERSSVNATGIAQLDTMPELRLFSIDNCKSKHRFVVNDKVFDFVARNPSISHLGLMGCSFDFESRDWIKPRINIRHLLLDESDCDDVHLHQLLSRVDNMHIVSMRGCPITNQSVAAVSKMPSIKKLHLERTNIDDDCLNTLINMLSLQSVTLDGTQITSSAIDGLQHVIQSRRQG